MRPKSRRRKKRRSEMNPKNRDALGAEVAQAAGAAVSKQGFVSAIDVFRGLGWLDEATVVSWRKGQLPYLERGVRANLSRISEAMKLFRKWATNAGLSPSETAYVRKVPGKPRLRFSVSGEADIEQLYRTHWVSKALATERREKKAERGRPKEGASARRKKVKEVEPMALWELGVELAIEAFEREAAEMEELEPLRPESPGPVWAGPLPRELKLRLKPRERGTFERRVCHVARAALKARGFVTSIDLYVGLGWLDEATLLRWRAGELPHLEAGLQLEDRRWIPLAMHRFRQWRTSKKLVPRREVYVGGPDGQTRLQFSETGEPHIERRCRTHWLLPALALELGEAPRDPDDDEELEWDEPFPPDAEDGPWGAGREEGDDETWPGPDDDDGIPF